MGPASTPKNGTLDSCFTAFPACKGANSTSELRLAHTMARKPSQRQTLSSEGSPRGGELSPPPNSRQKHQNMSSIRRGKWFLLGSSRCLFVCYVKCSLLLLYFDAYNEVYYQAGKRQSSESKWTFASSIIRRKRSPRAFSFLCSSECFLVSLIYRYHRKARELPIRQIWFAQEKLSYPPRAVVIFPGVLLGEKPTSPPYKVDTPADNLLTTMHKVKQGPPFRAVGANLPGVTQDEKRP